MLLNQQGIQVRWKKYIEELFKAHRGDIPQTVNTECSIILKELDRKCHLFPNTSKGPWGQCYCDRDASQIR